MDITHERLVSVSTANGWPDHLADLDCTQIALHDLRSDIATLLRTLALCSIGPGTIQPHGYVLLNATLRRDGARPSWRVSEERTPPGAHLVEVETHEVDAALHSVQDALVALLSQSEILLPEVLIHLRMHNGHFVCVVD